MAEKFRANIKEMIGLIADRLYNNTADIVIRELVQNSYDSVRRRYNQQSPEKGSIVISTSTSPPTLTITDNGEGMNDEGLRNYLSVLGQSLKKLSAPPGGRSPGTIGEYGIGFFACFMIADAITVRTRKPDSEIMFTWQSEGDDEFSIAPAPAAECPEGTSVTLLLQRGSSKFADTAKITEIVQRFCGSLDCPIGLDGNSEPINEQTFPWELSTLPAKRRWLESHFDNTSHFKTGTHRCKSITFGYAICYTDPDNAEQEIYSKRMFVTSTLRFVPEQFEFINVLVNCDTLKLNLARDGVTENAAFRHLQEGVEDLLWDFLKGLLEMRKQDHQLENYLKELQPAMRRRVLADPNAIKKFAPYLLFETAASNHLTTIPEYLNAAKLADKEVLFITQSKEHGLPSGQLDRLLLYTCERKQIPVVLVEAQEEEEVLRRVCVSLKVVKTRLCDFAVVILGPTSTDNKSLAAVQANFSRFLGKPVRIGKFPPPSLPLTFSGHEIILNQDSPLLAHLAKFELDSELSRSLYLRCVETCQTLDATRLDKIALEAVIQSMTAAFATWSEELARATQLQEELSSINDRWWLRPRSISEGTREATSFQRDGRQYSMRCFIVSPWHGVFRDVITVCKAVCDPIGILAETAEDLETRDILSKVCLRIHQCDFAIVDVTESSPNVLFELGILVARRKPAIILRNVDTAKIFNTQVPADIIGIERIDYKDATVHLKAELSKVCEKIVKENGNAKKS